MTVLDSTTPDIRTVQLQDRYGKFIAEPLPKGFGHTIGNSLRRIMLSALPGVAVSAIRIDGVQHAFSTIPGVLEDTVEIILNLKSVAWRLVDEAAFAEQPLIARIEAAGPGEVTGADIQAPPAVEVATPEVHIATLNSKAKLNMELHVRRGRGYVPAESQEKSAEQDIGLIPIDAIYCPVRKVNYIVEATRLGHRTDYDRLVLEVWTNGAAAPDAVISDAAKILDEYIRLFFDFTEREAEVRRREEALTRERDRVLLKPIDELEFSVRTYNCLRKERIATLGELAAKTAEELLSIRNFGEKSLNEVIEKLAGFNLSLREAPREEEPADEQAVDMSLIDEA